MAALKVKNRAFVGVQKNKQIMIFFFKPKFRLRIC